jgi:hypothetical protein
MIKICFYKKLKSKMVKFIICTIAGVVALFSISFNIGEELYIKNHTQTDKSVFGTTQDKPLSVNSELIIYDNMQTMTNDIMYASVNDQTNVNLSTEKIQSLRVIVNKMDYSDREYILSVLDRWQNGDFSQITDEHNYFYLKLKDYKN